MNPSASGWIKKLLKVALNDLSFLENSLPEFYGALKHCGFIYGSNVEVVALALDKKDLTEEELCKVNLLLSFYYFYQHYLPEQKFIESVINFYDALTLHKTSIFEHFLGRKKSAALLEDYIDHRIHIDDNIFTKNFNYFITNALLFIDVLAYKKFLHSDHITDNYLEQIEGGIYTLVIEVFHSKLHKSVYDDTLTKLFADSRRYTHSPTLSYVQAVGVMKDVLEKQYALDLVCMAAWTDQQIDGRENQFLLKCCTDLNLDPQVLHQSVKDIDKFYDTHDNRLAILGTKNFVQNFYGNSSRMVVKLISRNSKRLLKELRESKELMVLLTHSTHRDLTPEESRKVQEQLMDIFKSIPSLAIFMLPGGAILLPLFIKFIPRLLPSAFDENRVED